MFCNTLVCVYFFRCLIMHHHGRQIWSVDVLSLLWHNFFSEMLQQGELSSSMESLSYDSSVTSPASSTGHQNQRTKRMRTSFKHHQLRTMKTYFAINQNPDAKDLKQLAQKTGLSKRVLQVNTEEIVGCRLPWLSYLLISLQTFFVVKKYHSIIIFIKILDAYCANKNSIWIIIS